MTASPNYGTLVYNWDWSITYTRTDWDAWTKDIFTVTFSDWKKSSTATFTFDKFDDV